MRILIDILHPAHVHFFRHFRTEMLDRGHEVLVTSRDKDVAVRLLDAFDINHRVLSQQRTGRIGLARELVARTARLIGIARDFRPHVLTGIMGPSIALVGKPLGIPTVVFYDTELAERTNRWVYPLATAVCTPDSYEGRVRGNHITYPGYQELAYLHPNRFVPHRGRLAAFGLTPPFSLVRFTSWQASHDIGESGLDLEGKLVIVQRLREAGDVAISSEGPLPPDLEPYRLTGPVADIHHVLAFASLVIGETGTMTSEAAVLGTPGVFIYRRKLGYLNDLERRYGLVRTVSPGDTAAILKTIDKLLGSDASQRGRARLLGERIDVTDWMINFFETHRMKPST